MHVLKLLLSAAIATLGHLVDAPLQWLASELHSKRGISVTALNSVNRNVRYLIGGVQVTAVAWLLFGFEAARKTFSAFAFVGSIVIAMHASDIIRAWVQAQREKPDNVPLHNSTTWAAFMEGRQRMNNENRN